MEISEVRATEFQPKGAHAVFWDYWRLLQKQAQGRIPKRTDFNPSKVVAILPKLAVSEYIDMNTQIVRLVGGGHDGLWPGNMAGKNLFDFIDEEMAANRRAIYFEIMGRPCGCYVHDQAVDNTGRVLPYTGLILPTLSPEGRPTIFIGCYEFVADDFEMQSAADTGIAKRVILDAQYIDIGL